MSPEFFVILLIVVKFHLWMWYLATKINKLERAVSYKNKLMTSEIDIIEKYLLQKQREEKHKVKGWV